MYKNPVFDEVVCFRSEFFGADLREKFNGFVCFYLMFSGVSPAGG